MYVLKSQTSAKSSFLPHVTYEMEDFLIFLDI